MNACYLQIIDFRHFWVGLEGPEIKFSSTKMMAASALVVCDFFFRLKERFLLWPSFDRGRELAHVFGKSFEDANSRIGTISY